MEAYLSGNVDEKKAIIEKLGEIRNRVPGFSQLCLLHIVLVLANEQMQPIRRIQYITEYINKFRLSVLTSFGKDAARTEFIIVNAEYPGGLLLRFSHDGYSYLEIAQAVIYYFKAHYLLEDQQLASLIVMAPQTGYTYFLSRLSLLTIFDLSFDSSSAKKYGFKPRREYQIKLIFNESKRLTSLTTFFELKVDYLNQKHNLKTAAVSYLNYDFITAIKQPIWQDDFLSGFFVPGGFSSDSVAVDYKSIIEQGYVTLPAQLKMDFSLSSEWASFLILIQKNYINFILLSSLLGGVLFGVASALAIFLWPTIAALIGVGASVVGIVTVIMTTSLIGGLMGMLLATAILDPFMKYDGVNELEPQPTPQNKQVISIGSILKDPKFPKMCTGLKKLLMLENKNKIIDAIVWLDQCFATDQRGYIRGSLKLKQTTVEELNLILATQLKIITADKKELIFKYYDELLLTSKECAAGFANPILGVLEKEPSLNQSLLDDFKNHIDEQAKNQKVLAKPEEKKVVVDSDVKERELGNGPVRDNEQIFTPTF